MSANRDQFYSWLANLLKDKGWQFTRSGNRVVILNDKQQISADTGYWANPIYNASKPPRWIINFDTATQPVIASIPAGHKSDRIGLANTAQADKVGITVRIAPVFHLSDGTWQHYDAWEWNLLFLFPYPASQGSSSETFDFDAVNGILTYKGEALDYIYSALLALRDPSERPTSITPSCTYGEATIALKNLLHVASIGETASNVPVFDLFSDGAPDLDNLKRAVESAFDRAPPPPRAQLTVTIDDDDEGEDAAGESSATPPIIEEDKDLLGIDPAVYRQINAALQSGKQHLMLYGPPGTGKTTLARWIATKLAGGKWNLITGSADWSSQDIIGGYQPIGAGEVAFMPGILLKNFDQPLIIDELNRCDIDKVLGPLFTVLSGQHTSLPYRTDVSDQDSPAYVILPRPKVTKTAHEFAPGPHWRLLATINSIDKASLYQMSYALSRRFGWIYVDAPADKSAFLRQYLKSMYGVTAVAEPCPLASIWDSINATRVLGPAPFIDAVRAIRAMDATADFFATPSPAMQGYLLDAFDMLILPLMDGILRHEAESLADAIASHLGLTEESAGRRRVMERLVGVAV